MMQHVKVGPETGSGKGLCPAWVEGCLFEQGSGIVDWDREDDVCGLRRRLRKDGGLEEAAGAVRASHAGSLQSNMKSYQTLEYIVKRGRAVCYCAISSS